MGINRVIMGIISLVIVGIGLYGVKLSIDRKALESKVRSIPVTKPNGEGQIVEKSSLYELYTQMQVQTTHELLRKAISGYSQKQVSIGEIDSLINQWKEELKGKDLSLSELGRVIRFGRVLYEVGLIPQAKAVMEIGIGKEALSYGPSLLEMRRVIELKGAKRFKLDPMNLDDVLAVMVIEKVLEVDSGALELLKTAVAPIKMEELEEGPETGKVYILSLIGLYAPSQSYYQSGLHGKLYKHWSKMRGNKKYMASPRMQEALLIFESLEGKP